MAKTAAEIQRAYRERKKATERAERAKPIPAIDPLMSQPIQTFSEFYKSHEGNLMFPEGLHWVGVELDVDIADERPDLEQAAAWEEIGIEVSSLSVAMAMTEIFIDAAKELSELINTYKQEEVERQMEGASPVKIAQLEALRKRLNKRTSHFFSVIK